MTTDLWPQVIPAPTYAAGTKPVGYPAVLFSPYTVPVFPTDPARIGQAETTFEVESTSPVDQTNVPFTFGQVFKMGRVSPLNSLAATGAGINHLPLQMDVKATHPDGSVRHALISGVMPSLAADSKVALTLLLGAPENNEAPYPAVPRVDTSVSLMVAGVRFVSAPKTDVTSRLWLAGPTVQEDIQHANFVNEAGHVHPALTAQFCTRSYTSGKAKVDVTVEHSNAYCALGDVIYDVEVTINGTSRYVQAGLVHFPHARWKKTFWANETHPVHIRHNSRYLIDTGAIPNYDLSIVMDELVLKQWAAMLGTTAFGPMGAGRFQKAMGVAGGRPDIGLAPDSYVAAIISMDKRAKDMMLASADAAGSWSTHRRDDSNGPARGEPMDIIHFPRSTTMGSYSDTKNKLTGQYEDLPQPVTSSKFSEDTSHQPAFAYIPYLLTGDFYYLEELLFWNNYNTYSANPGYRSSDKGLIKGYQPRGQGWTLRTMGEAAYIIPDRHPAKQSAYYWLKNNLDYYIPFYATDNELGVFSTGYAGNYTVLGVPKSGLAPWQDDFITQSIGHLSELGFGLATTFMQWKGRFIMGRMSSPDFCWIHATAYALRFRDGLDLPVFKTFKEVYEKSFTPEQRAAGCNTAESVAHWNATHEYPMVQNEMVGYAWLTHGYPANAQPALAMAVDARLEGWELAWTRFANRAKQPKYSVSPQFAIIPRTFVAPVIGAPVPPPPPTPVEPTPDPTPVPTPVEPAPTPVPDPVPDPIPSDPVPVDPVPDPTPDPVPDPVTPPPSVDEVVVTGTLTADGNLSLTIKLDVLRALLTKTP